MHLQLLQIFIFDISNGTLEKFYSNLFPNSYIASCIVLSKSSQLTRFENDYQIFAPFLHWNHRLKNVPQTHPHTHRSPFQKLAQKAHAVNGAAPRSIGTREISVGVRLDAPPPNFDVWSMPGNG